MTVYLLPSITPTEVSLGIEDFARMQQSPFTGAIQTVTRGVSRLRIRLAFRNLTDADRAEMIAFVAKVSNREHRFQVRDFGNVQRGSLGGTPLVKGAGQTGNSLIVDGCTAGVTNWIRAGDQFQVETQLKICTADANTNGSGETTIYFVPALHESPADNAALSVATPHGLFILDGTTMDWATGPGPRFSDFEIVGIEDVLGV